MMRKPSRPIRSIHIDMGVVFSLLILGIAPLVRHFWFFIPVAVSLAVSSRYRVMRLLPVLSLAGAVASFTWSSLPVTDLDILGLTFFFLWGLILPRLRSMGVFFASQLVSVLGISFLAASILAGIRLVGGQGVTYDSWATGQLSSEIFPYFFQAEIWAERMVEVYAKILQPFFKAGITGWFAAMSAMSFFVSGALDYAVRGEGLLGYRQTHKGWQNFSLWKAPDLILLGLVTGMALLALSNTLVGGSATSWMLVLGWNLTVVSLFPVFIQGLSLASFLIPRASLLLMVVILIVLILNPIPVLTLAGLADLWFDFRSRIGSNPKSDNGDDDDGS